MEILLLFVVGNDGLFVIGRMMDLERDWGIGGLGLKMGYGEIWRWRFGWRAKREKRRWFSAAFARRKRVGCWGRWTEKVGVGLGWGILAVLVVVMSWGILGMTGERTGDYEERVGDISVDEEGWEGEFFGIEVRVRDGRIVLFREKKVLREGETTVKWE